MQTLFTLQVTVERHLPGPDSLYNRYMTQHSVNIHSSLLEDLARCEIV